MHRILLTLLLRVTGITGLAAMAACAAAPVHQASPPASSATIPAAITAPARTAAGSPTASPGAAVTPTLNPNVFTNPILDQDFPDPDTLKVGDTWYAYATNGNDINIQVARSKDLVHWEVLGDALPALPSWAAQEFGWAWAPDVNPAADGKGYRMYFVARYVMGKGGVQCIGLAESEQPQGPFHSPDSQPIICQTDAGGSIDPSLFVDEDGRSYLLWKSDGNSAIGGQAWIYIQPISKDGRTLEGSPTRLLTADQVWEGVVVEAPTLWKHSGKYYLFYSANAFNTPRYAVGVARADTILGPYTKAPQPVLKTDLGAGIVGPGGQDIVVGPRGGEWMMFHGWSAAGYRRLYLAPQEWANDWPEVKLHGRDPLPLP